MSTTFFELPYEILQFLPAIHQKDFWIFAVSLGLEKKVQSSNCHTIFSILIFTLSFDCTKIPSCYLFHFGSCVIFHYLSIIRSYLNIALFRLAPQLFRDFLKISCKFKSLWKITEKWLQRNSFILTLKPKPFFFPWGKHQVATYPSLEVRLFCFAPILNRKLLHFRGWHLLFSYMVETCWKN